MRLNSMANSSVFGHKNHDIHQKLSLEPHKAKTSKMRLNSTKKSSIFGRKNRENAPVTFL